MKTVACISIRQNLVVDLAYRSEQGWTEWSKASGHTSSGLHSGNNYIGNLTSEWMATFLLAK